jgi:DegV family protein with EDD domain
MKKMIILTESGADLPLDLAELYNIYVIPMHIVMDGENYLDGSIPVSALYDYYNRTKKIPSTSAVNPHEYSSFFQEIIKNTPDCIIIVISYSSRASCTYQNVLIASEGMENVYPIDSLNVSGGEAAIILKAAELIEKQPDISVHDLIEKINRYVVNARTSFIPDGLEYLKAGGRVSNAAYLGATVLQLKPLIEIVDGQLVSTKKYRGAMRRIVKQYMNDYLDKYPIDRAQIYLLYSLGIDESIREYMEAFTREKGFKKIIWIQTGCVISAHSGPGAIGISGFESTV